MKDVVEAWLQSNQYANIEGIELKPRQHPMLPDTPLMTVRGQAAAYHLRDAYGQLWILKKFLPGRNPDTQYIQSIKSLVPLEPGFECGYERMVLSTPSISASGYLTPDLVAQIENTILMRVVSGRDWASLADSIRDGNESLTLDQRLVLCQKLGEQIRRLEQAGLSHRDISSTNVFVDLPNLEIHFIDWDSLYHSTLAMPAATTFGTEGYIAPFVKVNGTPDAQVTWTANADRFAMAILNTEFLIMDISSPLTGDGGAFDQQELYHRGGPGISAILGNLKLIYPKAVPLIEKSLSAVTFEKCSSPDEWAMATGGKVSAQPATFSANSRSQFVPFNGNAITKLNRGAFVKLNQSGFVKSPIR